MGSTSFFLGRVPYSLWNTSKCSGQLWLPRASGVCAQWATFRSTMYSLEAFVEKILKSSSSTFLSQWVLPMFYFCIQWCCFSLNSKSVSHQWIRLGGQADRLLISMHNTQGEPLHSSGMRGSPRLFVMPSIFPLPFLLCSVPPVSYVASLRFGCINWNTVSCL